MVFSSIIFLFLFFPITLICYYIMPEKYRNICLLFASLLFYAWGEAKYFVVLLGSIYFNYLMGLWLNKFNQDSTSGNKRVCRYILSAAVSGNILLLVIFKYTQFIVENSAMFLAWLGYPLNQLYVAELPLGISFYTFHAISYIIDVYRKTTSAQSSIINLALYITFFPQAIAGPILRYKAIHRYLYERTVSPKDFWNGCSRFIGGLGKKVLIANPMGYNTDQIFSASTDQLSITVAWIGAITYALQIYFDFSGYSDMAIGLGRMFGFYFPENFQYPYMAKSIQEFWRRWHISLSTWFRDYLYIPLGGNRGSNVATYRNLLLVFILCGIWHGANWTFLLWGLWHGLFLVLERTPFGSILTRCSAIVQHLYSLVVVLVGWVIFRADTVGQAMNFISAMAGFAPAINVELPIGMFISFRTLFVIGLGIVFSTSFFSEVSIYETCAHRLGLSWLKLFSGLRLLFLIVVFVWSSLAILSSNYNPFIYYRF